MPSTSRSLPAFDFAQTTDYKGDALRRLNVALIVLSSLFVGARLAVRAFVTRSLGPDDGAIALAYLALTALSGLEIRHVSLGLGAHLDQIPAPYLPPFYEAITLGHLVYFWSVGLMRLAVVLFLLRLARDRLYRVSIYATGAVVVVQTVGCFLFRLFECADIRDNFKPPGTGGPCVAQSAEVAVMLAHGGVGIAVDTALLALPIWLVHAKMTSSARAARVAPLFGVGVLVVAIGAVRLALIARIDVRDDISHKIGTVGPWTDLEGHAGLWCACFPTLPALVRQVSKWWAAALLPPGRRRRRRRLEGQDCHHHDARCEPGPRGPRREAPGERLTLELSDGDMWSNDPAERAAVGGEAKDPEKLICSCEGIHDGCVSPAEQLEALSTLGNHNK